MIEPPDPDDAFMQMMQGMDDVFDGVDESVVDVSTLSNQDLIDQGADALQKLLDSGQAINPREQWARDLHSLRNAIQIEMRKRELER